MRWSLLTALGLVLFVTYGPKVLEFISPGHLNPFHSSIENCSVCHAAAERGPRSWLRLAVRRSDPQPDNLRCLKCHPLGEYAQSPHSLDPQFLKKLEPRVSEWPSPPVLPVTLHMAAPLLGSDLGHEKPLECGLCHQEHQGQSLQESWWGQDRCNSCHRKATARFDQDHPPFVGYPHREQTSIKFDHRSHFQKHFLGKLADKAPQRCQTCHPENNVGNMVSSIRFQPACGSCHIDQIREVFQSGPKGLKALSLPPLDVDALRRRGVAIGEWPTASDGELTPFMPSFFSGSPEFMAAFSLLSNVDTMNLASATEAQITAISTLVWSIKELVFDLLAHGRPALANRLQHLLGERPDYHSLAQLSGQMSAELIRSVQKEWFPHLLEEIALHRQGKPVPIPVADSVLLPAPVAAGGSKPEVGTKDASGQQKGLTGGGQGELSGDKGGLFLGDDKGGLLGDDKENAISGKKPGTRRDTPVTGLAPALRPLAGDAWIEGGGWYREGFSLYYLPTGHEDGFLRAWLDTLFFRRNASAAAQRLFQMFVSEKATGQCGKCHFGSSTDSEQAFPVWQGRVSHPHAKGFRKFSHRAHQSLVPRCQDCHPFSKTLAQGSPAGQLPVVLSGFAQLEKSACSKCHRPNKAGDACLECHNYHVGIKSVTPRPPAKPSPP
ncbi:MAG: hypothetical protein HQL63_06515 [Magnetococcales bacterium]|nr:hypothetical protein [Magnetococcales bacterium]